jgi:hypothetical protein
MAQEFLLMSPGLNSFLLLRDEQNSKCVCVWGGGGVGGGGCDGVRVGIEGETVRVGRLP